VQGKGAKFNWKFWLLSCVLLLIALSPAGVYFYQFGKVLGYPLAKSNDAWANFGSYLGGTIGPLISGIAFIYIYRTFDLQRRQHEAFVSSIHAIEISKLIDISRQNIDKLLSQKANAFLSSSIDMLGPEFSSAEDITLGCWLYLIAGGSIRGINNEKTILQNVNTRAKVSFTLLSIELERLGFLLINTDDTFEPIIKRTYYLDIYEPIVRCLLDCGYTINDSVKSFFLETAD